MDCCQAFQLRDNQWVHVQVDISHVVDPPPPPPPGGHSALALPLRSTTFPPGAVDHQSLGSSSGRETDCLREEITELKHQNECLRADNTQLKDRVDQLTLHLADMKQQRDSAQRREELLMDQSQTLSKLVKATAQNRADVESIKGTIGGMNSELTSGMQELTSGMQQVAAEIHRMSACSIVVGSSDGSLPATPFRQDP